MDGEGGGVVDGARLFQHFARAALRNGNGAVVRHILIVQEVVESGHGALSCRLFAEQHERTEVELGDPARVRVHHHEAVRDGLSLPRKFHARRPARLFPALGHGDLRGELVSLPAPVDARRQDHGSLLDIDEPEVVGKEGKEERSPQKEGEFGRGAL